MLEKAKEKANDFVSWLRVLHDGWFRTSDLSRVKPGRPGSPPQGAGQTLGVVGSLGVVHVALRRLQISVASPRLDGDDIDAACRQVGAEAVAETVKGKAGHVVVVGHGGVACSGVARARGPRVEVIARLRAEDEIVGPGEVPARPKGEERFGDVVGEWDGSAASPLRR
jgi:hypothetical protein